MKILEGVLDWFWICIVFLRIIVWVNVGVVKGEEFKVGFVRGDCWG